MATLILLLLNAFAISLVLAQNATTSQNDINALNYALTLEHLEAGFYNNFQTHFSQSDFTAKGYPANVYSYLTTIQGHENAHVTALTSTITSLGGSPVAACTYNFSAITDVGSYLAYARVFENTGVSAYDGAINTISDATLQQVAATIATVEGRHAAYLNALNAASPFPDVVDPTLVPNSVVGAVTPFLQSCTGTLTLPITRTYASNYAPPNNGNTTQTNLNDIATLNYALSLEHLEAAFYNKYVPMLDATKLTNAGFNGSLSYLQLIQSHENAHVSTLQSIITSMGGTPVSACTYDFSSGVGDGSNITSIMLTARALESTGVSAYDGAVNTLSSTSLQQAAATIATVEARHASYLNSLTGNVPFPDNLDTARNKPDTLVIAGGFISTCAQSSSAIAVHASGVAVLVAITLAVLMQAL